ncbi:MAG: nickel pincer cofactor biosynthesis protein LarC [Bacteroidales bacterium]|nr:nickel pincer cofactor biosynthesis protein LarC [Bacteroidales bacterium]MDT8372644.1 nickel pincer cofactor biosynthesis protein LarC [Bacteroidales bacterium]
MMRIAFYDCFSGISGDMNLGAMLDLGVDSQTLIDGLNKLELEGWHLEITTDQRHGITGTRVTVVTEDDHVHHHDHGPDQSHSDEPERGRAHHHHSDHEHHDDHDHEHHLHSDNDHEHSGGRDHEHHYDSDHESEAVGEHHHPHRNLADIEKILNYSLLSSQVKSTALGIFRHIAEAEAAVHGKPVSEIHFHEVGAIDSIIDIVGAAICFEALAVDRVYTSVVELGGGMVRCAHGLLPVPAPATARIISGFPVHTGGVDFEATTPTGAAIIAAMAEPIPADIVYVISKSGYGIGQKNNPSRPNILRITLAESAEERPAGHNALLVECNIDDMNPELSEHISGRLFAAGAGDVWFTPVIMKKGRPAYTLSVICGEEHLDAVRKVLFTESTTIGLRMLPVMKETLHREFEERETRFGPVVIKKSYYKNRLVSVKPEADRCAAIARETGLPMKQIIQEITATMWEQ